ncbi:TetR/AcrR family transcriptional regulator [Nocardioides sp. J54]|uniref:TetR/AcrR family transcriptional regulator n=1 Tax=Nocardioides sp. J54 TaxID=935866 RepID=UPI000A06EC24|nr:TetR/AcrR family transcriptional regulator [Nocardioides sp. J54]
MSQQPRKRRPYAARMPMEERRTQLLDAALRVIDRDGYDGVSIDAIAKEAGVTRPVVYGAFDGLGALLLTLLDRQQARAVGQLFAALPSGESTDPVEVVEQACPALHRMLLDDPVTWRAILRSPANVPDAVRSRIEGDRQQVREFVEGLVTAVLGEEVDAEVVAHGIIALLEHFGRLVLEDPLRYDAARLTATARSLAASWVR